jgi:YD repeat-containing protein
VLQTNYAYDNTTGNLTSITEDPTGLNRVTTFIYDTTTTNGTLAQANLLTTRDSLGDTVTRTYDSNKRNQLLTETTYLGRSTTGVPSNPLTTRYVYDAVTGTHLRFRISPDGRVTEYQYAASASAGKPKGALLSTLTYTGSLYTAAPFAESDLSAWVANPTLVDRTKLERTDYLYDFRELLQTETVYTATDSGGNGILASASVTQYLYDQRGQLLQKISPLGATTVSATDFVTSYTYDGLGRLLTTTEGNINGGYVVEGPAFNVYTTQAPGTVPLYRLFNPTTRYHFYTASLTDSIIASGGFSVNEGIVGYVYPATGTPPAGATPLYRMIVSGRYFYTASSVERDWVTTHGGTLDSTACYVYLSDATAPAGTVTLTRLRNVQGPAGGGYLYTSSETEIQAALTDQVRTTVNQYDDVNNRTLTTFANNLITTSTYNKAGELTSVVNTGPGSVALGTTSYAYDSDGRLKMVTDPSGVRTFTIYDEASRKVADVDGTGTLTEYVYDKADELVKTIRYADALSSSALTPGATNGLIDAAGKPTNVTLATLKTGLPRVNGPTKDQITRNVYNAAGQLVCTLDLALYEPVDATHPQERYSWNVTQRSYDGAGRVTDLVRYAARLVLPATVAELRLTATNQLIDPATNTTYTIGTDSNDRPERYFYDNDGHLIATLNADAYSGDLSVFPPSPVGFMTENFYNAAGELIRTVAYANETTSTNWRSGTLTQLRPTVNAAQDRSTYFFYDGEGQQIGKLDPEGYFTETQYDVAGHVSQSLRYDRAVPYTGTSTFQTLKTAASATTPTPVAVRGARFEYDNFGHIVREAALVGTTAQLASGLIEDSVKVYKYDVVGNLLYTTDVADGVLSSTVLLGAPGSRTTQARYDALGRIVQTLSREGSLAAYWVNHDPGSTAAQLEDVWNRYGTKYTYDAAGRIIHTVVGGNTDATSYYYDQDGNLRYTVNALGQVTENQYNALGQLTDTIRYTNTIGNPSQPDGTYLYSGGLLGTKGSGLSNDPLKLTPAADSVRDAHTTYSYALTGQVASTVTALNATDSSITLYDYNAFGQKFDQFDRANASSTRRTDFSYDLRGALLIQSAGANGVFTQASFNSDAFGRVISASDGNGNVTSTTYDRLGRTITTTDPFLKTHTTAYDAFDRVLTLTDAFNNTTK